MEAPAGEPSPECDRSCLEETESDHGGGIVKLRHAPEVAAIAADLIATVPRHKNLSEVRIDYLFVDKAPVSHGRVVLGRARKVGGLNAFLAAVGDIAEYRDGLGVFTEPAPFFVIVISHDTWADLKDHQRKALVDHELCHCIGDFNKAGDPVLSMRSHDFEEFAEVIERHGLWSAASTKMGTAVAEQLVLAIEEISDFYGGLGKKDNDKKSDEGGEK